MSSMNINNAEIVEKFKSMFKLKDAPIAFFYTDTPPQEAYNPKRKSIENIPCIIQLLNGVRSGASLVLGRESRNLCPGGLAYLGFRKRIEGLEHFLSKGILSPKDGTVILEGERLIKTPDLAKQFLDEIPFRKAPANYAVFMPLDKVNLSIYTPLIAIFFVKMDQLAGLIQLANYDTPQKTILGIGSACSTIITEPIAEQEKSDLSRPIVGILTDIFARKHVKADEATITISYNRLIQLYRNIDESFLKLESWKTIYDRML